MKINFITIILVIVLYFLFLTKGNPFRVKKNGLQTVCIVHTILGK